jgi:hypothetical protein
MKDNPTTRRKFLEEARAGSLAAVGMSALPQPALQAREGHTSRVGSWGHCKEKGHGTNSVPRRLAFRCAILGLAQAIDLRPVIRL